LATHPRCPPRVSEILFDDDMYDPCERDIYGFTCAQWRDGIAEELVQREQNTILYKLDQIEIQREQNTILYKLDQIEIPEQERVLQVASQLTFDNLVSRIRQDNIKGEFHKIATVIYEAMVVKFANNLIPIKLVLTEHSADYIGLGYYNAAISIGNTILEWDNRSLVQPYTGEEVCNYGCIEMTIGTIEASKLSEVAQKLAMLIAHWNIDKEYDPKHCNSVHFVEDVCKLVNCSFHLTGQIGIFMNEIKKTGESKVCIRFDDDFMQQGKDLLLEYGAVNGCLSFDKGTKLDEFVHKAVKQFPDFLKDKERFAILKGIDRSFWLQDENGHKDCPFGSPKQNPGSCWGKTTRVPKPKAKANK
jgi:hypothetical protein